MKGNCSISSATPLSLSTSNLSSLYKTLWSRKTRPLWHTLVMKVLFACVTIWAILDASHGVSTKMDFEEESSFTNSTVEDENVEVKHTIVVSTKLKNNNRRGLHSNDGNTGALTYNIGHKERTKEDSGEVPILTGYKAVETTQIRTPDTRNKPQFSQIPRSFQPPIYSDSVFINRNIRDDDDIFPNIAINPSQWKPSSFFNNINNWGPDTRRDSNFLRDRPAYPNQAKLHRKITEDGMKEFYCRKCRELNCQSYKGVSIYPQPRTWITTTPKMKLDGKLAKLN